MSKLMQRLLIFFIGIPLILSLVIFDFANHIIFHIAVIATVFISSWELYTILKYKLPTQPQWIFISSTVFVAIIAAFTSILERTPALISLALIISLLTSFCYEIFSPDNSKSFENVIPRLCSSTFGIVYIGFLSTYISQLTTLENANIFLILFFLMVFGCDSLAWFFGMLFGKNNRGFIKVSPNKSIVGFLGGIFGSVVAAVAIQYYYPEIFTGKLVPIIITAICVALASIAGDLVESSIKRSSACKDSGSAIPGRGGLLDSIDSILFAAPVYFILVSIFFV